MARTSPHPPVHATELEPPRGLMGFLRDFHNKTILFRIGDWIIVTYGVLAGIAFLFGFATATWYMAMLGHDPAAIAAMFLFFVIPSILMVSRLTSILLEWRELFR
jgi:prolipoprotein diacylglyceryltransferase